MRFYRRARGLWFTTGLSREDFFRGTSFPVHQLEERVIAGLAAGRLLGPRDVERISSALYTFAGRERTIRASDLDSLLNCLRVYAFAQEAGGLRNDLRHGASELLNAVLRSTWVAQRLGKHRPVVRDDVCYTGTGILITEAVLERGLAAELTDHLGYERGDAAGRGSPNSRNGSMPKTVSTEVGSVGIDTPRDRVARSSRG